MKRLICFALFMSCSSHGAERATSEEEELYFQQRMIPAAKEFIHRNGLAVQADFGAEAVTKKDVDNVPSSRYLGGMMVVDGRYVFNIMEHRTGSVVRAFWELQPNIARVETRGDTNEMRALAAMTNRLTLRTATQLTEKYLRLQGHDPAAYDLAVAHQVSWSQPGEPDYIALPFYQFYWVDRRADPSLHFSQKPRISITVSGVTSNLHYFSDLRVTALEDRPASVAAVLQSLKPGRPPQTK